MLWTYSEKEMPLRRESLPAATQRPMRQLAVTVRISTTCDLSTLWWWYLYLGETSREIPFLVYLKAACRRLNRRLTLFT